MTKHNSHEWKKEEDDDVDVDGDDEATTDVPRLPFTLCRMLMLVYGGQQVVASLW